MDISAIEKILTTFQTVSGMNISIYDSRYRNLVQSISGHAGFCKFIHRSDQCTKRCVQSDCLLFAETKANKQGKIHICPFGLIEMSAPIIEDDTLVAYLLAGPLIEDSLPEANETILSKVTEVFPSVDSAALTDKICQVKHYPQNYIESLFHLLTMLAKYIESTQDIKDTNLPIEHLIKKYLKRNFNKKIQLSDLSLQLHCSTVTLTEKFRKEYGITIMQYLLKKRMEYAEVLLKTTDKSIKAISEDCGFPDVEYFSKCFKQTHGIAPNFWRQQQRE